MIRNAPTILLAAALALSASACTRVRGHQGYIIDPDLVNAIQPRVDNRDSVLKLLGQPTLAGDFTSSDWYYVARETRNLAYANPRASEQTTLRIRFDAAGTVSAVERTGAEQIASFDLFDKKTPTLGRDKSFFEELFGNIGTVGAPGMGGGPGGNTQPN